MKQGNFLHHFRAIFSFDYIIHWFFFVLLISIVFFLMVFAQDRKAILLEQSQMPLMELYDFDIFEVDDKFIKTEIRGIKALRYAEYEITYDTTLSKINNNKNKDIEYVYGDEIKRVQDIYYFYKGGVYAKNDGRTFWSLTGNYDLPQSTFNGYGNFWMVSLEGNAIGNDIVYNGIAQTMQANNVKAVYELNQKRKKK